MKKIIIYIRISVLLTGLVAMQACKEDDNVKVSPRPEYTISQLLDQSGFKLFVEALELAGLRAEVDAMEASTIFAPNDNAFALYMQQMGAESLAEIDPSALASVLRYHIASQEFTTTTLPRSVYTLSGDSVIIVKPEGGPINLNGKFSFVATNRTAANGTFHGVSFLLTPPATSIMEVIAADPELSILNEALVQTGLDALFLEPTASYTVLAPTNDAFISVGITDPGTIDDDVLSDLLRFHVFPTKLFTMEFPSKGRFVTLLGAGAEYQRVNVEDLVFNDSEVVTPNVLTANGVVHKMSGVVLEDNTLMEALSTSVNLTGNDALGVDQFGALVEAAAYALFADITTNHEVYTHLNTPAEADFASNDEIVDYIERHVFAGGTNIPSLSNGSKIESIGGDQYYVAKLASTGIAYVNGSRRNAFTVNSTSFPVYDGTVYLFNGGFTPLPQDNIIEILSAQGNYSLFVKAAEIAGRTEALSSGDLTLLALNDITFEAETGLDLAALDALDPDNESDATTIADLEAIIDRHTINSVQFSRVLNNDLPVLTNVLGENLAFAQIDGETVIVEDPKFPDVAYVSFEDVDMLANNGVIHTVSKIIKLE